MPNDFGLTVRRHERHQLALPGLVSVSSQPAPAIGAGDFRGGRLRFSPESGVKESGFPATVVDLGAGGLGFTSTHFLPRGALLRVRVLAEGGARSTTRLDVHVRVQRVTMIDRKPTYLFGVSFIEPNDGVLAAVQTLVAETASSAKPGGVAC